MGTAFWLFCMGNYPWNCWLLELPRVINSDPDLANQFGSLQIRIQDLKKFFPDPDWTLIRIRIQAITIRIRIQANKDSVPGKSLKNWFKKISLLPVSAFNGFCWIRIRIIWYGSGFRIQPSFWYGSGSREITRILQIRIRNTADYNQIVLPHKNQVMQGLDPNATKRTIRICLRQNCAVRIWSVPLTRVPKTPKMPPFFGKNFYRKHA